jgi:hypothetical protein
VKRKAISKAAVDTEDLINEMYLVALSAKGDPARLEEISQVLAVRVLDLAETDRRASFRLFIEIVKPLVAGWMEPGAIHDDIIDGLLSTHKRRLIIATRYSAKSTLMCIFVAWLIFLEPLTKIMMISRGAKLTKIMMISRGAKLAARNLRTVRQVFIQNCPMLWHLKPTDECLDNAEQFQTPASLKVTTGGATMTSLGISSNLPGFRADTTIGDDVEGPQDDTPEKVVELEETLNELHMINPRGEKIMLGTFQSEYSIYAKLGDLTDDEGTPVWEMHRACMFEEDMLDGKKVYHSRWPGMFSDKEAMDWRRSVTERAWRLHAMLIADASILNERPLKISDLILLSQSPQAPDFPVQIEAGGAHETDIPTWSAPKGDVWYGPRTVSPDRSKYAQTIVAVDPASGLAGRDAIGLAVLSITPSGYGVIRHLEGVRGVNKIENIKRVASIVAHFGATNLVVEELADGLFGETLEGQLVLVNYPMMVEKVTTGQQQKGRRIIEALAPPMGAGRLIILESVARSDHGGEFVNQLVRISYDGRTGKARDHDDIVDALAHAVAVAKGSLVSDISDNVAEHHIAKMERFRDLPLKYGGLGGDGEVHPQTRRAAIGDGLGDGRSLAERLVDEDEVLVSLEVRRNRLQETVQTDLQTGRQPEQRMVKQIRALTEQIEELRSLQVL